MQFGLTGHQQCIRDAHFAFDSCQALDALATQAEFDTGFFARLIWQESRFEPNAVSPANTMGIAQFISSTADLRGLEDAFSPADPLEYAAQYLYDLLERYGNEGLAAATYNGGQGRADGFLEGRELAQETWAYVPIITGLDATIWRDDPPKNHDFRLSKEIAFMPACLEMAKNHRLSPLQPPPGQHSP